MKLSETGEFWKLSQKGEFPKQGKSISKKCNFNEIGAPMLGAICHMVVKSTAFENR